MAMARGRPVDPDPEAQLHTGGLGAQHEVDVAGVEAVRDPAAGLVQGRDLWSDRPVAGERPRVQRESVRLRVDAGAVAQEPPGDAKPPARS